MKTISIITAYLVLLGCHSKKMLQQKTSVNYQWLDSLKKSSDTTYIKKYGTAKFAKAEYFNNTTDGTVCQVMKDVADTIRQIIISKNNKRIFFAEYYPNGQLIAQLPLDSFGQYQGHAVYYFENGLKESKGDYISGKKTGVWENYNDNGKMINKNSYDSNGQVINH